MSSLRRIAGAFEHVCNVPNMRMSYEFCTTRPQPWVTPENDGSLKLASMLKGAGGAGDG